MVEENKIEQKEQMERLIKQKTKTLKSVKEENTEIGKEDFLPEFDLDARKPDKIYNICSSKTLI